VTFVGAVFDWGKSRMKMRSLCKTLMMGIAMMASGMTVPTVAFAQADCACIVPAGPDGLPTGSITGASGQVQVSQTTGFAPGGAGSPLQVGSQVIVGPQSSASISVGGSCNLQIQQNSDVVLEALDGDICVRVSDSSGQTAGGPNNNAVGVVLGLGAIGGIVALAVSDSDSVSD